MTEEFKKRMAKTSAEHIEEFGDCTGVVEGPMFPNVQEAEEVDVRWHPSKLRYGYFPKDLEVAAPATYRESWLLDPEVAFKDLRDELDWERRGDAPRGEYYCNDFERSYIYGSGRGRRLYEPRPWHPTIMAIRRLLELEAGTKFEVCFLNRYMNQSDHLGWHADDSPEMDDARPIAVVSLGVEREIWFREKPPALVEAGEEQRSGYERRWRDRMTLKRRQEPLPSAKLLLGNGSLLLMAPGMQETHQHRIPKSSAKCGERISLTFRGYVREEAKKEVLEGACCGDCYNSHGYCIEKGCCPCHKKE
jgi:alkylated DNA repair dioxygenase AlkB